MFVGWGWMEMGGGCVHRTEREKGTKVGWMRDKTSYTQMQKRSL